MKKVLLIEDDVNLAFMTIDGLESEGFQVSHLTKGEEVMTAIKKYQPDIVLLDVNLKGAMNGFEVSKKIRQTSRIPIIFTTSRAQIDDVQEGFGIGNVDYLKKPFGIRELILRINELLSRNPGISDSEKTYLIGNFLFSPTDHSLLMYEERNHLNKNESTVLTLLCENKGKVIAKKTILETVWHDEDTKHKEASLNNILSSLRSKLSKDNQIEIETIPKIGYRLIIKADN